MHHETKFRLLFGRVDRQFIVVAAVIPLTQHVRRLRCPRTLVSSSNWNSSRRHWLLELFSAAGFSTLRQLSSSAQVANSACPDAAAWQRCRQRWTADLPSARQQPRAAVLTASNGTKCAFPSGTATASGRSRRQACYCTTRWAATPSGSEAAAAQSVTAAGRRLLAGGSHRACCCARRRACSL